MFTSETSVFMPVKEYILLTIFKESYDRAITNDYPAGGVLVNVVSESESLMIEYKKGLIQGVVVFVGLLISALITY